MPYGRWETLFWTLAGLGGLYAIGIASLTQPWVQKHALYMHRIQSPQWLYDIDKPEAFGFARGQVVPFRIQTGDGESLYAWHVVPLGLYADDHGRIANELVKQREERQNRGKGDGFEEGLPEYSKALLGDENARVVLNFHGNAGNVAQGRRVEALKALSSAGGEWPVHIITFDYRGFGKSTGTPSEEGLIKDGLAVIDWAMKVAKVDPSNIVILGHSLGTAVATATVARYLNVDNTSIAEKWGPVFPFGGLLLSSGFSSIPELIKTYALAGVFPLLSPLKGYPRIEKFLSNSVVDTWDTASRLRSLTRRMSFFHLHIMHAINDFDVRWHHSETLFDAAEKGRRELARSSGNPTENHGATMDVVDLSRGSTRIKAYYGWGPKLSVLKHGSHNQALASAEVAIAVRRLFEMRYVSYES